jgi:hypothetical protein
MIVERHGATIATSDGKKPTIFQIVLPISVSRFCLLSAAPAYDPINAFGQTEREPTIAKGVQFDVTELPAPRGRSRKPLGLRDIVAKATGTARRAKSPS